MGVTAYGAAYATVHDLYIHGRFVRLPTIRPLEHLRHAHALHHRFGGEPYGMLCPIVPRELGAGRGPGATSKPIRATVGTTAADPPSASAGGPAHHGQLAPAGTRTRSVNTS